MISFPPSALSLAGFALAHAAWSMADADPGEMLCPLGVIQERDGARRILRFEADTQEQAIIAGKDAMHRASTEMAAWAFAREGAWRKMGAEKTGDVLAIDFWSVGMTDVATLIQPFSRAERGGRFRIGGVPTLVLGDTLLARDVAQPVIQAIVDGVHAHSAVAELWPSWQ